MMFVVRALQERRVDGHHGPEPLRRETRSEGDRVVLQLDSDVEKTIRKLLREKTRLGSTWHRSRDSDDGRHFLAKFRKAPSEDGRVPGPTLRRDLARLSRRRIVTRRQGVPFLDVLPGGEPFALLRDDVYETRSRQVAHGLERLHEHPDVVPVDRAEISEPELPRTGTPGVNRALMLSSQRRTQLPSPKFDQRAGRVIRKALPIAVRTRLYSELRCTELRYFDIAPTFGAIDISLSFNTTMRSRPECPALFNPS